MLTVAAFYKFTPFEEPARLVDEVRAEAEANGIKGTVLIAGEGLNGTVAGTADAIAAFMGALRRLPGCADLTWKESTAETMPFGRMKVRLKSEIVTMGQPDVDPRASVGTYVAPEDWNALIEAEDVVVIDTRNDYETAIGTFENAVDPGTRSFRDFPKWWKENAARFEGKRVAMFCTGGIRCEKATNWVKSQGADEVLHLQGGILKYLETVPEEQSKWRGECFVFDQRVSLGHGLSAGTHDLCHACRRPVSGADKRHPDYEDGVSCHRCIDEYTDADRARFRERERQVALAEMRGTSAFGR